MPRCRGHFELSAPAAGALGDSTGDWSQALRSAPTTAVAAIPYISGVAAQLGIVPPTAIGSIDRGAAGVWRGEPFSGGATVSGTPSLSLTVRPPTPDLTVIGILFDEDPAGNAVQITQFPLTRHDLTPGVPNTVAWDLAPTFWHLPAGHRLTITVTTQDPIPYVSSTPNGAMVEFTSPSFAEIPVA
ncbi:CocE/NonD family hydrolase C-terminal non-catalytic domain-containing protein [Nocardia sp. GCM10030253]|uniref:CocE/NonD family hydrolase C-terminal non-catalytic domain-containing protein n=1 Tax=Nocardia sp. GCM10030253 TaxID=3273404 RepID=UPI00363BAA74